jgi:hypothetical protein
MADVHTRMRSIEKELGVRHNGDDEGEAPLESRRTD